MNKMKEMIKQAMRDEMTLEDILRAVEDARAEVEEERTLCVDLDTARKDVILAALNYMVALGIFPTSYKVSEMDVALIENTLKGKEPEFKTQTMMMMPMLMGSNKKNGIKMGIWRP